MRELAILTFVSLDGVMQAPKLPDEDPSGGFTGGWADPYWDETMAMVQTEAMSEPYDVLFGRNTYDMFAAHAAEDHPMRTMRKYVATSRPDNLAWENSVALTGDIAERISELKNQQGPLLQVHGSHLLLQLLLARDLVDELRIWTFPVVLGEGKRLFGGGELPDTLRLSKTGSTANGVVMSIYRPVR